MKEQVFEIGFGDKDSTNFKRGRSKLAKWHAYCAYKRKLAAEGKTELGEAMRMDEEFEKAEKRKNNKRNARKRKAI